jgi:hypothetical protein
MTSEILLEGYPINILMCNVQPFSHIYKKVNYKFKTKKQRMFWKLSEVHLLNMLCPSIPQIAHLNLVRQSL